jgi:NTE family protein
MPDSDRSKEVLPLRFHMSLEYFLISMLSIDRVRHVRIGLVLGAGGVLGGAWLSGALSALTDLTGWQPRHADVLLGTSAGAIFAAALGAGLAPAQLFPVAPDGADNDTLLADLMLEEAYRGTRRWPRLLPGSIGLAARALRERAFVRVLSGLLPRGLVATTAIEAAIARMVPTGWAPHPACWVVACDYRTGDRAVFGRPGAPLPPLTKGVAASCAIPGFFSPVDIAGRWYVDGGLRSMSNADLLADQRLDLVIVLNPMSGRTPARRWAPIDRLTAAMRAWSAFQVDVELARLIQRGARTLLIEPTPDDLDAMGTRVMEARRARRVAELARETTTAQLQRPAARRWLDALAA